VTSPVQGALRHISDPVAGWLSDVTDIASLRDENRDLREENERLKDEVGRLREGQIQLEDLQKLLEIKQQYPDEEFVAASVLARDPSSLKEAVAIDKGKRDGLEEGMVVVTEGHSLVGRITHVFDSYSWVTLITDPSSAVIAMVQESRAEGVVSGNYSGQLAIEFVAQAAAVKEGDSVITSTMGGRYPAGLMIGKVTAVGTTPQELFKKVSIEPLASLSHLETVLVLTSFLPRDLEAVP
jgi:rod shape-determining protein MreC